MEAFTVPQFLEVEDKIIGPITTRQFVILVVGGGLEFIAYKVSDIGLFIFLTIVLGLLVLVLGFLKINGQPFHYFLINFVETSKKPRLRIWRKKYSTAELKSYLKQPLMPVIPSQPMFKKAIGVSRLSELALIVDTGGYYAGENSELKK
ncbi:MAG: PrgI family protein [Candidatus Buchananbacteria bacterium]